jgi:hypothetical protein
MRPHYPKIEIIGNHNMEASKFLNAIRFSTHGEYFIAGCTNISDTLQFPHFNLLTHSKMALSPEYRLQFDKDGHFNIETQGEMPQMRSNETFLIKSQSNPFIVKGLTKIDFIRNPDGHMEFLCAIDEDGKPIHLVNGVDTFRQFYADAEAWADPTILTITLLQQKIGDVFCVRRFINKFFAHWELYRAVGINVPLLIIQVLLGRNVTTLPMVNLDDIIFYDGKSVYRYPDKSNIWFDLDETLICRHKPIQPLIELFNRLKFSSNKINLLTRHKNNVDVTLSKIDIARSQFDKIVIVQDEQKKSAWVNSGDMFIDNEFPQRRDVRLISGAMVLDLDQIDFLPNYSSHE